MEYVNIITVMKQAWLGALDELGGYGRYVVADSREKAEAALLKAWQDYDKLHHSDYHEQVKKFDDLAEIYGAYVRLMPWNQYVYEGQ